MKLYELIDWIKSEGLEDSVFYVECGDLFIDSGGETLNNFTSALHSGMALGQETGVVIERMTAEDSDDPEDIDMPIIRDLRLLDKED